MQYLGEKLLHEPNSLSKLMDQINKIILFYQYHCAIKCEN